MIWTPPERRIVFPARPGFPPRRRRAWHRPGCPALRAMAAGAKILDSTGKKVLDSAGRRCYACDCTVYVQCRRCDDNSLTTYWVDQRSVPVAFRNGGVCYSAVDGNPTATTLPAGATLGPSGTVLTGCDVPACQYVQAKRCDDDSDADLWFYLATAPARPFFFTKSGVTYYVADTNNISLTHGTLASGYTMASGCLGGTNCCNGGPVPAYLIVTISGTSKNPNVCCDGNCDCGRGGGCGSGVPTSECDETVCTRGALDGSYRIDFPTGGTPGNTCSYSGEFGFIAHCKKDTADFDPSATTSGVSFAFADLPGGFGNVEVYPVYRNYSGAVVGTGDTLWLAQGTGTSYCAGSKTIAGYAGATQFDYPYYGGSATITFGPPL